MYEEQRTRSTFARIRSDVSAVGRRATRLCTCLVLLSLITTNVIAADRKDPAAASTEHPLVVFAIASGDRLKERSQQLADTIAQPDLANKLKLVLTMGLSQLTSCDDFDSTRPMGFMSYLTGKRGIEGLGDGSSDLSLDDLLDPDDLMGKAIYFFPVHNGLEFVESLGKIAKKQFIPTPGTPGYFVNEHGKIQPLRIRGKYVFYFSGEFADRELPDLPGLLRPLLINRDVVLSVQARGIPALLRETVGEQIKMSAAARLQRFDDEPEVDFRWRTSLGAFQQQLIDIAVSHVDEINLGLKFDANQSMAFFDLDVVGPRNGKLAKLCSGLSTKQAFFPVPSDEPSGELEISMPIDQRMAKPLIDALLTSAKDLRQNSDQSDGQNAAAEVFQSLAATLEAGHFDMRMSVHGSAQSQEYLLGFRLNRINQVAEALPVLMAQYAKEHGLTYELQSIDEVPVHRITIGRIAELLEPIADATISPESPLWLAFGQQTIWIAFGSAQNGGAPVALREAIRSQSTPRTVTNKSNFPLQLRARTSSLIPPDVPEQDQAGTKEIEQVSADAEEEKKKLITDQLKDVVRAAFRDRPDSIRLDARPTDTGLKIRITCEEALVMLFAATIAEESLDFEE